MPTFPWMFHHSCHKMLVHTCFTQTNRSKHVRKMTTLPYDSGTFDEIDGNVTRMRVAGEQSVGSGRQLPKNGSQHCDSKRSSSFVFASVFFRPTNSPRRNRVVALLEGEGNGNGGNDVLWNGWSTRNTKFSRPGGFHATSASAVLHIMSVNDVPGRGTVVVVRLSMPPAASLWFSHVTSIGRWYSGVSRTAAVSDTELDAIPVTSSSVTFG